MSSTEWLCFNTFLFTIGLRFPFSDFITDFFRITDLIFSQTMSLLWRVLVVLDRIKNVHIPDPIAYRLRSHGSSRFLFYSTTPDPLILQATRNEEEWKSKFFFVKRSSIPGGVDYPVKWLTMVDFRKLAPPLADSEKRIKAIYQLPDPERSFVLFSASPSQHSSSNMSDTSKMLILLNLDELDSYPTPIQVKKDFSIRTTIGQPAPTQRQLWTLLI
ncbi:hypothetical protein Hanom_Chr02g00133731 [Helianthus anomalus]